MNFLILAAQQEPSPVLSLSVDRLVLQATKESQAREAAEEARREHGEEKRRRRRKGHKRHRSPANSYGEGAGGRTVLRISGTLLRSLCLSEATVSCKAARAEAWTRESESFGCVLTHTSPEVALQVGFRLVSAQDMAAYRFNVQTELLLRGSLVVFTSWDNLASIAVPPRVGPAPPTQQLYNPTLFRHWQQEERQRLQRFLQEQHRQQQRLLAAEEEKAGGGDGGASGQGAGQSAAPAGSSTDQSHRTGGDGTGANALSSTGTAGERQATLKGGTAAASSASADASSLADKGDGDSTTATPQRKPERPGAGGKTPGTPGGGAGGSPWSSRHHQRQEAALDVVSAYMTSEDLRELNELIDDGVVSTETAGEGLLPFLCSQCHHLPATTLTMDCCGALVCPRCQPTPPARVDAPREARRCPICEEEPLRAPHTHPRRDVLLSQLVKELKVLYHPQLKELRRRAMSQREGPLSPDAKSSNSPYLMDTSSLGLL